MLQDAHSRTKSVKPNVLLQGADQGWVGARGRLLLQHAGDGRMVPSLPVPQPSEGGCVDGLLLLRWADVEEGLRSMLQRTRRHGGLRMPLPHGRARVLSQRPCQPAARECSRERAEVSQCWWACWDDGVARRCRAEATPTGFCTAHIDQPRLKLYGEPPLPSPTEAGLIPMHDPMKCKDGSHEGCFRAQLSALEAKEDA